LCYNIKPIFILDVEVYTVDYEIIDCHIHPFIDSRNYIYWFYPENSFDDIVSVSKRAGISKACGSVVRKMETPSWDDIKSLNDEALTLRDKYSDFYIPGIHVHPSYPQESCRALEELVKNEGVRWIGELVGYMMGFDNYAAPEFDDIWSLAQDLEVPANIHPHELSQIDDICTRFPELKVVIAHPTNGKATFLERVELVAKHKNLHLDISGSGIIRWQMVRKGIDVAGKGKILFGTDVPISNPAVYVEGVKFENLTEGEFKAVFQDNFLNITGLSF
jgi:predicted TIM-barrel fold metal-dependent hydrolase